ncbi:MAG: hypothetical protein ACFFCQ_02855 [Promethearchaeota archaeon]
MSWSDLTANQRKILYNLANSYKYKPLHTIKIKSRYKERVLGTLIRNQSESGYQELRETCRTLESMGLVRITNNPYWPEDLTLRLMPNGAKFLQNVSEDEEKKTLQQDIRIEQEKRRRAKKIRAVDEEAAYFDDEDRKEEKTNEIGTEDDPTLGTEEDWDWEEFDIDGPEEYDDDD